MEMTMVNEDMERSGHAESGRNSPETIEANGVHTVSQANAKCIITF
jgi:hypothetical protein